MTSVGGVREGPELTAVLCALAGNRVGDPVALVRAPEVAGRAVLAAGRQVEPVLHGARLALAGGDAVAVREAVLRLAPGGRLVATSRDVVEAGVLAAGLGLRLRHVTPVAGGVAWSAVLPAES